MTVSSSWTFAEIQVDHGSEAAITIACPVGIGVQHVILPKPQ
jgi:hypothetical protein